MRIIAYGEGIPHNFTSEFYNLMDSKSIGDALLSHKNKFYIMWGNQVLLYLLPLIM